jgi:hypothetical protein
MKLKCNLILIITSTWLVTFSGCSGNQQQVTRETNLDSVNLSDNSTKKELDDFSSFIAIFSTEGKLIKNLKYNYIELNANRHSNEPTDYHNYIKGYPLADTIVGDFNGDGKTEKAWFKDKGIEAFEDCRQNATKKSCEGTILFSDKTIKPLKIDYCPMYIFKNEGDLYGDGKDAIGVLPGWFSSACREYSVFTLKQGRWELACSSISNTLNMREAGIILIEKDLTNKGWVLIRESVDSYISRVENHNIPEEYIRGSGCQWSNVVEQTIKLN